MNKIQAYFVAKEIYEKECVYCLRLIQYKCVEEECMAKYKTKEFSEGEIKSGTCCLDSTNK